jgi:hypothetical protein
MKNIFLIMTLILSIKAHAQNVSTGGGNGGQTVYIGNNAYLRDIVENNNCTWKNYAQIVQIAPKLFSILNQLNGLNSSFTLRIKEEMMRLGYCFTNKRLPYLQYNNSDDLHIFPNQEFDQVAINDSGIVFVDTNIFNKMDDDNKAYLFMHEAAHELFDKKEERVKREPRLREFLMNLFRQLDFLSDNQNVDALNFIIQNAKFTALEDIYNIDHQAFAIVMNNMSDVSLAKKVEALKALGYSLAALECKKNCVKKFYSKTLIANIRAIETERAQKLDEMIKKINYRSNIENFEYLVAQYKNLNKYVLNDQTKIASLVQSIVYILQNYDLASYEDALNSAMDLINIQTTTTYYSGHIAENYDRVHGAGTFATNLLKNNNYLVTTIFGGYYTTYQTTNRACYECRNRYNTHVGAIHTLDNKNLPIIKDIKGDHLLNKYLLNEIKFNIVLKQTFHNLISADLRQIKNKNKSSYLLPARIKLKDVIYTQKRDVARDIRAAKFKGNELKELIKSYETILDLLK